MVPVFWERVVCLLAVVGGGAALAAGQLLAGLQATAECARSVLDYDTAKTFPFPPENLLTAVAPDFFGDLDNVHYWGRWLLWEDSLFVGVTALALAVYGAIAAERRARRFSVLMIGLALILALGFYTPLYRAFYLNLPGFGSFRGASKFIFLVGLFLAMLTAAGLDRLLRAKSTSNWPVVLLLAAAIVSAGLGAAIWRSAMQGPNGLWVAAMSRINFTDLAHQWTPWPANEDRNPHVLLAMFVKSGMQAAQSLLWCGGTCAVVAGAWWLGRRRRFAVYGLVLLAAIELCVFACENRGQFHLSSFHAVCEAISRDLTSISPEARVSGMTPGMVMMAGGYTIDGDDPMVLRRYAEFSDWAKRPELHGRTSLLWRLFRLQLQPQKTPPFRLAPLPWQTLAHAQLVPHCKVVPNPSEALALMEKAEFDPRQTVLLEGPVEDAPADDGPGGVLPPNPPAGESGSVEMTAISTDEMDIRASTPRPAILLISDNYATGWEARSVEAIPPQPSYQVVRGDYVLRAIPLAAGKHHLRLEYHPWGWVIGRWISLAAAVIYLLGGAICLRSRRWVT